MIAFADDMAANLDFLEFVIAIADDMGGHGFSLIRASRRRLPARRTWAAARVGLRRSLEGWKCAPATRARRSRPPCVPATMRTTSSMKSLSRVNLPARRRGDPIRNKLGNQTHLHVTQA